MVTGARSEYGILRGLLKDIAADPALDLRLYVTGAHLSPAFGSTISEIRRDGLPVAARVPILGSGAVGPREAALAVSRGVDGFSRVFARAKPDLLLLMSDRYEMLAAASAALLHRVVVAHISGGKLTEGSMDESVRHAVTKLSHYHFTHNDENRRRLIRMGEQPSRVFATGSPFLDEILRAPRLGDAAFRQASGLESLDPYAVVLYHPETLGGRPAAAQMREVLSAVEGLPLRKVLLYPGADPGSREVIDALERFGARPDAAVLKNLPRAVFVELLRRAAVLVGNSSCGVTDTPALGVPAVNVGDRQKGMLKAGNVLDAPCRSAAIRATLKKALAPGFRRGLRGLKSPYGDGRSSARILALLKRLPTGPEVLKKPFYEGPVRGV